MALNDTHMPVSPAQISEDNLMSPMRIVNGCMVEVEGVYEKNGEVYPRSWQESRLEDDELNISWGRDSVDCCSSSESTYQDIVDLLPSDPFEMDIETSFTVITEWLEELEFDCGGYTSDRGSKHS